MLLDGVGGSGQILAGRMSRHLEVGLVLGAENGQPAGDEMNLIPVARQGEAAGSIVGMRPVSVAQRLFDFSVDPGHGPGSETVGKPSSLVRTVVETQICPWTALS